MAESKRHDIRILLAKFSEIFLDASIRIKILQLKHLWILQMIDLYPQKLRQSSHALFMQRLIDQLSEDQLMNMSLMRESEANLA